MFGEVLLLALVVMGRVQGFMISLVRPEFIAVHPGEEFTLICATDSHYEHCDWKHPLGNVCNFEWKRSSGSVLMQECDGLKNRVKLTGNYNQYQCGIIVKNAQTSDSGIWTCDIEQYIYGDFISGSKVKATMNVSVVATTTPIPTPTTSSSPLAATTTAVLTSAAPTSKLTTPMTTKNPTVVTDKSTVVTEEPTTSSSPAPSYVPEPVPQKKGTEKASSSTPVIVGVLVVLVVAGVLVGGVFYYRKRNAANGAVHYKPDPNDDKVTLNDRSNRESIVSANSNLHEYYPPNLTYSTTTPDSNA